MGRHRLYIPTRAQALGRQLRFIQAVNQIRNATTLLPYRDMDLIVVHPPRIKPEAILVDAQLPSLEARTTYRPTSCARAHTDAMTHASDAGTRSLREQLVEQLRAKGHIENAAVAEAFRVVSRHAFLPGVDPAGVYTDEAFPTKRDEHGRPISSSSQPAIMAVMLEQLAVAAGHHVLEIGAGTGYNAALLDRLVGPMGAVTTVDIDEDLVVSAREHLAAAHASRVEVVHGDGGLGWPDRAPYDRIIVTAGAWEIPPAWTEQLAPHGRLVLPLSLRTVQQSVAFEPVADYLASVSIRGCGFMPMRGAFAGPETIVALDPDAGLFFDVGEPRDVEIPALGAAIRNGDKDIPSGVRATGEDL
ncbi:MAG TPA: methyltransferase domain-containing protein [Mycobacterium sp.]|nr:methyltransferase domain-containing protein [Mycobacterium sp.]